MDSLEQTIHAVIRDIAAQAGRTLPPLERHHTLTYDLGLRSLDLAQLVATLEMLLGVDPFARLVPITNIRTVRDLCDAYALAQTPSADLPALAPATDGG